MVGAAMEGVSDMVSAGGHGLSGLSAAVVLYRPDLALLRQCLLALQAACVQAGTGVTLCLVDNSETGISVADRAWFDEVGLAVAWQAGHGNVGFGRGHNLAIARAESEFHLVLNPDLELEPEALVHALAFMRAHPEAALVVGDGFNDAGQREYLCKRYPTVFDLFLRGFAPRAIKARFRARLDRYEMRDVIGQGQVVWDPPIVSGCFMLFRTEVLRRLGGFDPSFFLYFVDFDLSIRARGVGRVAYVPAVRFVHHGGYAAKKGLKHIRFFCVSAARFFSKHGWRWW